MEPMRHHLLKSRAMESGRMVVLPHHIHHSTIRVDDGSTFGLVAADAAPARFRSNRAMASVGEVVQDQLWLRAFQAAAHVDDP